MSRERHLLAMDSSVTSKSGMPLMDINGYLVPYFAMKMELIRQGMSFESDPKDIILVSYPRSGTHWIAHVIWGILHDAETIFDVEEFNNTKAPFLELAGVPLRDTPSPRFLKTHIARHLAPNNGSKNKIWITRNPFDCCVSCYFWWKSISGIMKWENPNFEEFFSSFLEGQVPIGHYFDHFKFCFQSMSNSNILHVTYEDMKRNPKDILLKVARFLGEEYYDKILKDEVGIKKILRNTSFDVLSNNADFYSESLSRMKNSSDELSRSVKDEDGSKSPIFFRKGVVGDWKNHFSNEQEKRMREWIDKNLDTELRTYWKELGYDQI